MQSNGLSHKILICLGCFGELSKRVFCITHKQLFYLAYSIFILPHYGIIIAQ